MTGAYLLDTHAFVWAVSNPSRLSDRARQAVARRANRLVVSAASAWEVATKVRLGKMPEADTIVNQWDQAVRALAAIELPVTARHAIRAGGFAVDHRDPFDRMLAAQAMTENITLVTVDVVFGDFPITTLW